MPDPNAVSILLRRAREERGLEVNALARAAGVARNHVLDIEAGTGRSFHSLTYCRKAVEMIAQELGLAKEVADAWRDEDWDRPVSRPRMAILESSTPSLLPSPTAPESSSGRGWRRWAFPVFGGVGLVLAVWLAMDRIEERPPGSGGVAGVALSQVEPTTEPASGALDGFRGQVELAFSEWVQFWRDRRVEPYSALYDPGFVDLDRHLAVRRLRIAQASFIEVEVRDVDYRESGPGEMTVRFRQVYRSDGYQSTDLKELVWRRTSDGPRIMAERLVN